MRQALLSLFTFLLGLNPMLGQCDVTVEVPQDLTICTEGEVHLDGIINGTESCFNWVSDQGYFNDDDPGPFVFVDQSSIFTFTAYGSIPGINLITNGDFESGDDGSFTTDYEQASPNCIHPEGFLGCEGVYEVMDDPSIGHTMFDPCTPMGSSQMVVNGAPSLQQIWCQQVDVIENRKYEFSAWAQSVNGSSPAQLQFAIDGTQIGNILGLSGATCNWEEIEEYWLATSTSTIEICITNQNTAASGNDFALDDIFFGELCSDEMEFNVLVGDLEIDPDIPSEFDCNTLDLELSLNAFSTNTPLEYEWSSPDFNLINPDNNGNAIIFLPGTYIVTVTDDIGCTIEHFFDVESIEELPEINLEPNDPVVLCDDNFVAIFNTQHQVSYEYNWELDQTVVGSDPILAATEAGEYFLTVTDTNNGCSSTLNFTVSVDDNVPLIEATFSNPIDCNNPSSQLILNTTATLTSIEWFDTNGNPLTDTTVSQGGLYTVSVVGENGCVAEDMIEIPALEFDPQVMINTPATINCDNPTSIISADVIGNFNLDWSGPNMITGSGNDIIVTSGGIYVLTVSDDNACSTSFNVEIIEDLDEPSISLSPIGMLSCDVSSISISVDNFDPLNQYNWLLPNSSIVNGQSIDIFIPGDYTLTVISPNGCTADSTINIIPSGNLPILNISGENINCLNNSADLSASGTYNTIEWSDANGPITDLSVTEGGWYYALADNGNGCSVTDSVFISVDTISPSSDFIALTLDCDNPEGQIFNTQDNDYQYTWTLADGSTLPGDTLLVDEAGTFPVIISAVNGCISLDSVIVNSVIETPLFEVTGIDTLDCNTTEIQIQIEAISNISSSSLFDSQGIEQPGDSFMISEAGEYFIEVLGANGCPGNFDFQVVIDTSIAQTIVQQENVDCQNTIGQLSIENPNPNFEYQWIQGTASSNNPIFQSSSTESINLTSIDLNTGCTNEEEFTILVDTITPSISYQVGFLTCTQQEQEIFITPNGNYQYQWLLPNGQETFDENLIAQDTGNYELTIIGENACSNFYEIYVDGLIDLPEFEVIQPAPIDCNNATTTIEVTSMQQLAGFTAIHDGFSLSFGTGDLVTDQPGEWTVQATATNGCTNSVDFTIEIDTIPPNPTVEIENINCLNTIGLMTVNNPDPAATYTWEDSTLPGTTIEALTFEVDHSSPVSLFTIGGNGCESQSLQNLAIDTISPTLNLSGDQLSCINSTTILQVDFPNDSINYEWFIEDVFLEENNIITTAQPGIYTVIATSQINQCKTEETIELFPVEMPVAFDFSIIPPPCGEETFLINDVFAIGGNGPYTYNTNPENPIWLEDNVQSTLMPGSQSIQIQDANGCILDTTFLLTVPQVLEAEINEAILVNWGLDTTFNVTINKPIEEIESITWTPSEGLSCSDCLSPRVTLFEDQVYEVKVIDINGCEEILQIRVEVILNLMVYVPNVFTPDALDNNLFFPFATDEHIDRIDNFYIFDRWGNRIFTNTNFSPNDPSAGWNGTILDGDALPGVYSYIMEVIFNDATTRIIAGDVTLVR